MAQSARQIQGKFLELLEVLRSAGSDLLCHNHLMSSTRSLAHTHTHDAAVPMAGLPNEPFDAIDQYDINHAPVA